jgi:endonuclease YncB( thermonuclease family)
MTPKAKSFRWLLIPALVCLAQSSWANEWEKIRNCRLMENESNDGDSFHVAADGEERIFRLYFVDTPEAEDGGRVAERVTQQADTFGISEEASVEMGKKAAAFTRSALSRPFTVLTRGQNALGSSQLKREYAFITTADGEDLGEMLVSRGLARSFGEAAAPPGETTQRLRSKYDRLEAKARSARLGAWGDGSTVPTLALPSSSSDEGEGSKEMSNEEGSSGGMPDITDLMPSASDILKDNPME